MSTPSPETIRQTVKPMTLMEPHVEDDTLTLVREANGWFRLTTDDGEIELHESEAEACAHAILSSLQFARSVKRRAAA